MKKLGTKKKQSGFSVVEVLIAAAVLVIYITGISSALIGFGRNIRTSGNKQRAVLLAEEALEASRNIRDASFANLVDGTYGVATGGNQWNFTGSSDATGIFTRQTAISTINTNQKQVTSTVSWSDSSVLNRSVSLSTYLTNWQAVTGGSWANCAQQSSLDLSGSQDGLKVQVSGNYAYLVRDGGTPDFAIIDVSSPSSPALVGSLSLAGDPTNIAISGNYAYVSSRDNSSELQIINITSPASPTLVGTFNASGNADAYGVFVSGTTVYLGRASSADNEFIIINASTPSSPSLVGSLNTSGDVDELVVLGNFAYIASAVNSQELQVIDISTPSAPSLVGSLNLSGNQDALTITGFGTTVVLGRADNFLYLINVSTPTVPVLLGSYDTGGNVNDIALGNSNSYAFLANSAQTGEFQIVDISTPAVPTLVCSTDLAGQVDLNGIAYSSTLDRAFGAGIDNTQELVIISPN